MSMAGAADLSVDEVCRLLDEENEQAKIRIRKLKEQIAEHDKESREKPTSDEPLSEQWHLQGEILALEKLKLNVFPQQKELLTAKLEEELQTHCKQLEQVHDYVKAQKEEVKDRLQREEELLGQDKALYRELQSKLAEYVAEEYKTDRQVEKELEEKHEKVCKYQVFLMRKLSDFCLEHFPRPGEHPASVGKRKKHTSGESTNRIYLTLQAYLEVLLNKLFDSPHDPYINLSAEHWDHYTESLLRCGIILRHPKDCNRVRMEAFHE